MSTLKPAPERISRDPRFVRPAGVLAAGDDRRFNALAPVAGDAPHFENHDRHESNQL
jgi:hypothetical protein